MWPSRTRRAPVGMGLLIVLSLMSYAMFMRTNKEVMLKSLLVHACGCTTVAVITRDHWTARILPSQGFDDHPSELQIGDGRMFLAYK